MSQKLNSKQRKLVQENHNLIYSFLNIHNLGLDEHEDWYGTAAIGLCRAALVYDESRKIKFSTLAYICMENEVRTILRIRNKNISPNISLDSETNLVSGNGRIKDIIPDNHDFYNSVYLNDAIELATQKLSDRDKEIIDMIINRGITCTETAKRFGVTKSAISQIYCKFIKCIKKYFNE